RAAWQFNLDYGYTSALVLWALGWSMVGLAALVWLGDGWIATVGLSMVLLHNLLDDASPADVGLPAWLWTILHQPGTISLSATIEFFVLYPLIPWVGVMALGYVFAPVFTRPSPDRDRICVGLGLAACLGFVVLRLANGYGDPSPWVRYESETRSALSVLAATKYPASLQYLLMTLGPVLLLLPPFGRAHGLLAEVFRTFGRTPLFFWLLHVPLIHLIAVGLSVTRYGAVVPWLVQNPPVEPPPAYGYPLWVVYAVTLSVVVALYPVCRWFDELKRRRRSAWLSYL
ncbi:MAG TPA: hypothetical protein VFM14_14205, partial [Gemmatimonadales bacterium]|nr:hypothetical protein [Gemmatimonadales bacterium]